MLNRYTSGVRPLFSFLRLNNLEHFLRILFVYVKLYHDLYLNEKIYWSGYMVKAKGKSGIGSGTGKKGWNRWQAGANKAKSAKPYVSKGVKKSADEKNNGNNN